MGKTVASIIGVVAAVAIAIAAPYLAPLALGALGITATATAIAIATAVITIGLSVAVMFAFKALGVGSVPKAKDQIGPPQVFRQSITDSFLLWGKRRVGGLLAFFHARVSGSDHYRYFVVACVGHQCQGLVAWMLNDETVTVDGSGNVTSGAYAGAANLKFYRGTDTDVADPTFVSECGGNWTTNHKGLGVAKFYARFQMTDNVVQAGMPNITAVIEGRDEVYDYRTGTTGYSRNAVLVFYDFMAMAREEGGFGAFDDEIPLASWIGAEADVCDQIVGGNPRYALDAYLTTGASPSEVRDSFVVNCAGTYTYSSGKHLMRPGHWVPVTATLEESDVAGPIQVTPFFPADTAATQVQGSFIDPASGYQGQPFTTWNRPGAADVTQIQLDLAHTTVRDQADRVAAIMGKRAACEKQVVWPMNIVGLAITTMQNVQANTSRYGLSNYAWIVSNWQLTIGDSWGAVLSLREENEEIYDDPTPASPSSPGTIQQPGGPLLTIREVQNALRSSYPSGLTITAADAGSNAKISLSAFTMQYPGGAVSISAPADLTGLAYSTTYFLYCDVTGPGDASPTFGATTVYGDSINSTAHPYRIDLKQKATTPASGGGSTSGSGTGSGYGSGDSTCVTVDTDVLLDGGILVPAGELRVGDIVRTQHEHTLEWGDFAVEAVRVVEDQVVWKATVGGNVLRATPDHRVWLDGRWQRMRDLGVPDGRSAIVKITVEEAHTYVANGVLSHNIKDLP